LQQIGCLTRKKLDATLPQIQILKEGLLGDQIGVQSLNLKVKEFQKNTSFQISIIGNVKEIHLSRTSKSFQSYGYDVHRC